MDEQIEGKIKIPLEELADKIADWVFNNQRWAQDETAKDVLRILRENVN